MDRDDFAALVWLILGFWVLLTQMDLGEVFITPTRDIPKWFYDQKEDIVFIFGALSWIYSYLQTKLDERAAENRSVKDTLNVSVNSLIDQGEGRALKFRTLQELQPSHVFADNMHFRRVTELAERTTLTQPFLELDSSKARDQEITKILCNYLSSKSAQGHLAKDMGLDVCEHDYVFGLTNEKFGGTIAFKLRLMLIRVDALRTIFEESSGDEPLYEAPSHAHRWKVLKVMADMYFNKNNRNHGWMIHQKVSMVMRADFQVARTLSRHGLRRRYAEMVGTDWEPGDGEPPTTRPRIA